MMNSLHHISIICSVKMDTAPEVASSVVALLESGLSVRNVANQLNISKSTVSRLFKRYRETNSFNRRPGSGRTRKTTARDDRFIMMTSLRNRHISAVGVQHELQRTRDVAVSEWTVRRRLKEKNLTPKRAATGPRLTPHHRQARLDFALQHVNWTHEQWSHVLFTDESRACLYVNDRRERVYRRPGEPGAQCCIKETVAFGGGSCMFWGGITSEVKSDIVFINCGLEGESLMTERYKEKVLEDQVIPFAAFYGEEFVLMHDNARPHKAIIVTSYLEDVGIDTLVWPANSPDLNPIEHLWDMLKRKVRARNPSPVTTVELKMALREEWDNLPQDVGKNLIFSMKNRLEAVIRARGETQTTENLENVINL